MRQMTVKDIMARGVAGRWKVSHAEQYIELTGMGHLRHVMNDGRVCCEGESAEISCKEWYCGVPDEAPKPWRTFDELRGTPGVWQSGIFRDERVVVRPDGQCYAVILGERTVVNGTLRDTDFQLTGESVEEMDRRPWNWRAGEDPLARQAYTVKIDEERLTAAYDVLIDQMRAAKKRPARAKRAAPPRKDRRLLLL